MQIQVYINVPLIGEVKFRLGSCVKLSPEMWK